jgi:hypothetical protein
MRIATKPRDPAPPPRPGGILSRLRDVIILLAGGGVTWTETEKQKGRY